MQKLYFVVCENGKENLTKQYEHDESPKTAYSTLSNKEKTVLKHTNPFAPFLVKMMCPTVLADVSSDVLKLVVWMSMTDNALGRHELQRLMLCKYC
uniref:Coatomer subunit zeta n=1 Tax=Heterorhabditis bacteriophora TaxID=37862 RepID=A0A1I7W9C2_HETBA